MFFVCKMCVFGPTVCSIYEIKMIEEGSLFSLDFDCVSK